MKIKVVTIDKICHEKRTNPYLPLLVDALVKSGVEVTYLGIWPLAQKVTIVSLPIVMWKVLFHAIFLRLKGYKILHLHWNVFLLSPRKIHLFLKYMKLIGYKVVWTVHETHRGGDFKTKDFESSVKIIYDNCSAIVCFGEATKNYLLNKFDSRIPIFVTLAHGTYEDYLKYSGRPNLDVPNNAKVFLLFGVLRPTKNVDKLISAFKELSNLHRDAYLIIAGSPFPETEKEHIERLSDNNVHIKLFMRSINDNEVSTFFNRANFVVLPYDRTSGFSGVLFLAATFHKPVIAASIGANGLIGEIVSKYRLGIVYDSFDESLLDALKNACKISSEDYSIFVKNIKAFCQNRSWENVAREMKTVYKSILEK